MKTSRERFLDTCEFKIQDKPWLRWGSFVWPETDKRWRTEGYDGTALDEYFNLDRLDRVDPYYGPMPEFRHEVVAEDEETVTYINEEGILMKEFKVGSDTSMPQFLKFPIETEAEYDKFKAERLLLRPEIRFQPSWIDQVKKGGRSQTTVGVSVEQSI